MKVLLISVLIVLSLCLVSAFGTTYEADEDFISFKSDVRPIISKNCAQCHNAESKLPDITKYEVAFELKEVILSRMNDRSMPHAGRLEEWHRDTIKRWVEQGARP